MKNIFTLIIAMLITLAGFSQTTTPPVTTQVTLTGSGSDPDGTIVSYSWRQISGPASPTIVTPNAAITVVKDYSVPGVYKYELTVTDNRGGIGRDTTQVTVLQAANINPHADAGATITIQLPPQTSMNLKQPSDTYSMLSIKKTTQVLPTAKTLSRIKKHERDKPDLLLLIN